MDKTFPEGTMSANLNHMPNVQNWEHDFNLDIKNTNWRDLRNLIESFIQLLPFNFRLQFSTTMSVLKLVKHCYNAMHEWIHNFLSSGKSKIWHSLFRFGKKWMTLFYSLHLVPCEWGWPCSWLASLSSPSWYCPSPSQKPHIFIFHPFVPLSHVCCTSPTNICSSYPCLELHLFSFCLLVLCYECMF